MQSINTYSLEPESRLFKYFEGQTTSCTTASSSSSKESSSKASSRKELAQQESLDVFQKLGLPTHTVQSLRKGYLHSMWINVYLKGELISLKQVEDFSQSSANDISKNIRAVIYGVLLRNRFEVVKEYDREATSSKATQKEVMVPKTLANYGDLPVLENIDKMTKEQLQQLVLAALESDSVSQFPDHHQLPMAVTRYWYQKSQVDKSTVDALLMSFLICSKSNTKSHLEPSRHIIHAYAQWQSCLIYANDLNVMLKSPFPEFDIDALFSGMNTHELAKTFGRKSEAIDTFLHELAPVKKNYQRMWDFVHDKK